MMESLSIASNPKRQGACLILVTALLAGCVTSETSRGTGTGSPAGGSSQNAGPDRNASPISSSTSASEETRRRARIRLELSASHFQQGNYPLALQESEQAVRIDPNLGATYGMQGLIFMAIGDRVKANDSFLKALQLDPKDAELNNNYGWYLCQSGRQRDALPFFNTALEDRLYATPSRPLHNAGICLLQIGDDAGAENYLLRSFQADPGNAVAMFNLGQLYLNRRNAERAKFYSDRLLSSYQPTAETTWLALRVARLAGDEGYAGSLGQQLRSRFPQSPEATLLQRGAYGD